MKKLLKILIGIVCVFVLAIAAAFFFTADMTATADEFFTAVKNKDMEKAYTYLSEDFQSGTTKKDLQEYLKSNSFSKFKEANWQSRSFNGGRGDLTGSIATDTGGVIPITLSFVKEENDWKIYSIQKPSSGIQEETTSIEIPSEQVLVKLVNKSMSVFSDSVNEKSMVKFHSHVSNLWQQQFSPEKFDEAFGSFYELDIDLALLESFSPQFSAKPNIDEDGVLLIKGHYPTQPNQVYFEQKYLFEGLGWKLIGFNTNIK
jgi:uncharacterized protein YxeA